MGARKQRIEHLKRCMEQVFRLSVTPTDDVSQLEMLVDKDRQGQPGDVVIEMKFSDRKERWRQTAKKPGWFCAERTALQ